jgi:hypothetical protein
MTASPHALRMLNSAGTTRGLKRINVYTIGRGNTSSVRNIIRSGSVGIEPGGSAICS